VRISDGVLLAVGVLGDGVLIADGLLKRGGVLVADAARDFRGDNTNCMAEEF
jgi:hypothetical protein